MMPTIAILGAGPSGLILGRFLELANIDYVIFERDESAKAAVRQGGTLDVHADSGQLALQEAGLFEQFKEQARFDAPTIIADKYGKVLIRFGEGENLERPEIDRKDLRALLLDSIPPNKVRWGKRIQQVQKHCDGSMSVHFADGSLDSGFQLVVAADGAWSKARNLVTSSRPQFSGLYYLTTSIRPDNQFHPTAASLIGQGSYMGLGDEKQIAGQKLGDGSYYISIGLHLSERWSSDNAALLADPEALRRSLLQKEFADWPPIVADLIRHSDGDFRAWPLYAMPTSSLSWETVPGVTLVGDAAHVTTPFQGEGVNCAMYDSYQLAQHIVKYGLNHLDRAVSEYEKLMFPRAIDLIERSEDCGKLMFAKDTPRSFLQSFGFDVA